MSQDFRPVPLYPVLSKAPFAVTHARPITIEWSPNRFPSEILVPVVIDDGRRLDVRISDAADDRELTSVSLDRSNLIAPGLAAITLPPATAGRLRVRFSSDAESASAAPSVMWTMPPPQNAVVRVGDGRVKVGSPSMLLEYPWPSRYLLVLWLGAVVAVLVAGLKGNGTAMALVVLGLAAVATSVLLWQRDYSIRFSHWDADSFGMYGAFLASWVLVPANRAGARAWMGRYIHAYSPLGPVLVAIPIAMGAPMQVAFIAVSTACSFGALLIVRAMLRSTLRVSDPVSLAVLVAYVCHIAFLRAFARPVTDALGHLLTAATLALLLARTVRPTHAQLAALAILNVLNALARPQGAIYIPFVTATVVLLDRRLVRPVLVLAVVPLAIVGAMFVAFGWASNARELLLFAQNFRRYFTLHDFGWSVLGTFQLLPLLWMAAGWRWLDVRAGILIAWIGYYVGVLIAVQAPFWLRHFTPLLPAIAGLTALALERVRGRVRAGGYALLAASCVANVAVVVDLICDRSKLSLGLFDRLTLG